MMIESFIIVFIFGLGLMLIGSPLFATTDDEIKSSNKNVSRHYMLKKNEVLDSLKDLELDHNLNKVSDEDFKELYAQTMEEGVEVLKKLEGK